MNQIVKTATGMSLPTVDFGKQLYIEDEGHGAAVLSYKDVSKEEFLDYISLLNGDGYAQKKVYRIETCMFYTLKKGQDAVYATYYPTISEMRIVAEKNSAYLNFSDVAGPRVTSSQITQLELQDFGLSIVLRLADGRFIILDGGWPFEPDADNLMQVLREQSADEKPVIAAWIMTHPHLDHYRCFLAMMDKYAGTFTVENFIYNFPELKEGIEEQITDLRPDQEMEWLPRFYQKVEETGAKVYKAHTGQVYDFSNLHIEMLSTPDDVFFAPVFTTNKISLVMKWIVDGQHIFITGDADMNDAKMGERYGHYLKSDIFQIPHHGFNGGSIAVNRLIDPEVCLVPSFENDYYRNISIYDKVYQQLIYSSRVAEMHTGAGNVTLPLPYHANPQNRQYLLDHAERHQRALGAKSWFFSDFMLSDCQFTLINAARATDVFVDLLFEDSSRNVDSIKIVAKGGVTKIDFNKPGDIDGDALFFNRASLKIKGVDPAVPFALHFSCKYPIVIKANKPADYMY